MQRRKYSVEYKYQVVKEAMEVGNGSLVARKYEISADLVNRWVREHKKARNPFSALTPINLDPKRLENENEKLKKLLGEKELEIEILRDLLKKNNPQYKIR